MPKTPDIVAAMHEQHMLPAIFFIFSRAACDDNATRLSVVDGMCLTSPEERELIGQEIARLRSLSETSSCHATCLSYTGSARHSCHCEFNPDVKQSITSCGCGEWLKC